MEQDVVTIGQSVVIKGELNAKEDLIVEGQLEGKVELDHNVLTIGPAGRIKAQVLAKKVIVMGKVDGNITATEAIQLRETATVDGELVAPQVSMADGASFRGRLDTRHSEASAFPGKSQHKAKPVATGASH
jgi:cytoskeletal protein CcmA (bactofilin family)